MKLRSFFALVALTMILPAKAQHVFTDDDDPLSTLPILNIQPEGEREGHALRVRRRVGELHSAPLPNKGCPNVPVVLVQFPDRPFATCGGDTEKFLQRFNLFFNGENDAEVETETDGNRASVQRFFKDQSQEQFQPKFHLLGPVQLSQSYAFYGKNSGNDKSVNINKFYSESLSLLVKQQTVDWSIFDHDGDGLVDMVFFIFAGWGENAVSAYDPDAIWPHEKPYAMSVTTDDGSIIRFACMGACCEARYRSKSRLDADAKDPLYAPTGYNPANLRMDGVGTSIHELSHALGLPDLYDTSTSSYKNFGIDMWGIMDYGCYSYGGRFPSAYAAYEREFLQWETPIELTEPAIVSLKPFQEGGVAYKISNDLDPNEYYLVENRQPVSWDEYNCTVTAKGMLLTHVQYDRNKWTSNRVNATPDHPNVTLITANDSYISAQRAKSSDEYKASASGWLYPHAAEYQDLTDETTPSSVVYKGGFMHKAIRNIHEEEDGTITFCFRTHGQLTTPTVEEAEDIKPTSFKARWQSVENATNYYVECYRDEELVARENVTDLEFTFTDLKPSSHMKFRVLASAESPEDYINSEWSDFVYVDLASSIDVHTLSSQQLVDVYSVEGRRIATIKANQISRLNNQHGLYILRYADGQTRKVSISSNGI